MQLVYLKKHHPEFLIKSKEYEVWLGAMSLTFYNFDILQQNPETMFADCLERDDVVCIYQYPTRIISTSASITARAWENRCNRRALEIRCKVKKFKRKYFPLVERALTFMDSVLKLEPISNDQKLLSLNDLIEGMYQELEISKNPLWPGTYRYEP